jgi:SulP family sulfate permease
VLGSLLFMHRMAESVEVASEPRLIREDEADATTPRTAYDSSVATARDIMIYRISGAFFFASTARISQVLERIGELPRVFVLDFSEVPFIDSTAAHALASFANRLGRGYGACSRRRASTSRRSAMLNTPTWSGMVRQPRPHSPVASCKTCHRGCPPFSPASWRWRWRAW